VCVAVYDVLARPVQEHLRLVAARPMDGSHLDISAHAITGMSAGTGHRHA
jgi:phenylacetic acid degradation operon negative regulatory protein